MASALDKFEVEVVAPKDLRSAEVAAWRAIQESEPEFSNPLFGPDFSRAVGRVRADARVAVFRLKGEPVAFFPFHQRLGGLARPIGAPFSDYQGLVSKGDIGLTGRDVLQLVGLSAFRFNGLVDPHGVFEMQGGGESDAYAIVLNETPDAFLDAARTADPRTFEKLRHLEHWLGRKIGPLRLVADDRSPKAFRQLLAWKSEQLRRAGQQDVLRPEWVAKLMQVLFETRIAQGRGLMMTLYAGDTLVAGHFGMRTDTAYHPWVASTNPELSDYAPGQVFLGHAVRAMPGLGLKVLDLGPGDDCDTRPFANVKRAARTGLITAPGFKGALSSAGETIYAATGLAKVGAVDGIRRRFDQICTVDPTPKGVLRGLGEAAFGFAKRSQFLSDAAA